MRIDINTDNLVTFTNKLEKLHKSALPVAIRGTLNDAAFKFKKETMPQMAKAIFEERQPNFFKANSRVEPATGFNINAMASTAGFLSSGLHNAATNYAVKDLEDQEHGGTIQGRSFKPLRAARIGGRGNVKANARISKILKAGNIVDMRDSKASSKMQQFIKASVHAGVGGFVLGGRVLFRVTQIKRTNTGNTIIKKENLYSFKKSGVARVTETGFVRKSALKVQKEMEKFYILQATKQIKKALA